MAKFPTDVDESVTIAAPRERVYAYLWDVVGSSRCVPDLATCERVALTPTASFPGSVPPVR